MQQVLQQTIFCEIRKWSRIYKRYAPGETKNRFIVHDVMVAGFRHHERTTDAQNFLCSKQWLAATLTQARVKQMDQPMTKLCERR